MKKINNLFTLPLLLFTLIINSCAKNNINATDQSQNTLSKMLALKDINNGDLIFVGAEEENLSGAINRVTQLNENTTFDHVGIIEKTKDSVFVLHAAPKGGSQREFINDFYNDRSKNALVIYRLKNEYLKSIPQAIINAKNLLGKPYNWDYILNNEEYYCSDFVERAFRNDQIFDLIPMNFKNPKTGEIDQFWIDFYDKKGKSVPQNEPGTNPNQIASSDKLLKIGQLLIK